MSKTVLANVGGFTPTIDSLVAKYGLVTAIVFGRVWRYCQGERGVCSASQEKIATALGLKRETINRHMHKLVEGGYLEDLTPELLNRPHTYRDTGKAGVSINMQAFDLGVIESHTTVIESHSSVIESHSKKEVKRQERQENAQDADAPAHFLPDAQESAPTLEPVKVDVDEDGNEPTIRGGRLQRKRKTWEIPPNDPDLKRALHISGNKFFANRDQATLWHLIAKAKKNGMLNPDWVDFALGWYEQQQADDPTRRFALMNVLKYVTNYDKMRSWENERGVRHNPEHSPQIGGSWSDFKRRFREGG